MLSINSLMSAPRDGRSVFYGNRNGRGGTLALDPAAWERDLFRILGNRRFTPDR